MTLADACTAAVAARDRALAAPLARVADIECTWCWFAAQLDDAPTDAARLRIAERAAAEMERMVS